MLSTYAGYQFYARDPDAAAKRVAAQASVSRDTAYYRANIGKVKSVDDLLADNRLYTYALKSFGLEDAIPNRGFIRKVLTSDLTQPKSFANSLNDTRYRTLAAAFGFTSSGKVASAAVAQGDAQEDETLGLYSNRTLVGATQTADVAYYQSHIGNVHSITDLTADSRLYRIALQAYGLDPTTTSVGTVTQLLESDRFSANSVAAQSGSPSNGAQSEASIAATTARYAATVGTDAAAQSAAATETAYYRAAMPDVHSVDAFLSDTRLVNYVAQAFSLASSAAAVRTYAKAQGATDPTKLSAAQSSDVIRAALTSDLSAAGNVADTLGGGFRDMAAALGFGPRTFQSVADTDATVARYATATGIDAASQTAAAGETAYYQAKVATMRTPDQLVADPRLMAYVTQAFGLTFPATATDTDRRQAVLGALTGDPTDPAGAAAKAGPAFVALASAFESARPVYAQSAAATESTIDLYGQRETADPQAAAAETAYYRATMPGVKSVDALLGDSRLTAYLVAAYDIAVPADATAADTTARLRAVLTSDPGNAAGAAAAGGLATQRLAAAFRFDAKGAISAQPWPVPDAGGAVQSDAAARATADLYAERLGPNLGDQAQGRIEIDHAQSVIAAATTVDDVVADKDVVAYLAKAYGIALTDGASVQAKASAIRAILTSDPDDPKSVASQQGNGARALAAAFTFSQDYQGDAALTRNARTDLAAFASAFNFDASGKVVAPRVAQSPRDTAAMLSRFKQAATAAGQTTASIQADTAYLQASIGKVRTLGGFLSDLRLVSVATTAYGIVRPAGLSDATYCPTDIRAEQRPVESEERRQHARRRLSRPRGRVQLRARRHAVARRRPGRPVRQGCDPDGRPLHHPGHGGSGRREQPGRATRALLQAPGPEHHQHVPDPRRQVSAQRRQDGARLARQFLEARHRRPGPRDRQQDQALRPRRPQGARRLPQALRGPLRHRAGDGDAAQHALRLHGERDRDDEQLATQHALCQAHNDRSELGAQPLHGELIRFSTRDDRPAGPLTFTQACSTGQRLNAR